VHVAYTASSCAEGLGLVASRVDKAGVPDARGDFCGCDVPRAAAAGMEVAGGGGGMRFNDAVVSGHLGGEVCLWYGGSVDLSKKKNNVDFISQRRYACGSEAVHL